MIVSRACMSYTITWIFFASLNMLFMSVELSLFKQFCFTHTFESRVLFWLFALTIRPKSSTCRSRETHWILCKKTGRHCMPDIRVYVPIRLLHVCLCMHIQPAGEWVLETQQMCIHVILMKWLLRGYALVERTCSIVCDMLSTWGCDPGLSDD